VPFLVSYGNDANIAQGSRTNARTSLYDLLPTMFDMAGLNSALPQNNPIDGVSIKSALEGQAFDRGLLYFHYPHRSPQDLNSAQINGGSFVSAVSDKDWKLIFFYEDRHYELYNLKTDIGETTNLLAYNPGVAHDLSLALNNYLVGVNALMPVAIATHLPVAPPTILVTPIPGDYNGDSLVNAADYDLWRTEFGSTTHLAADGNRNGVVDTADFVVWRNIFAGFGIGSGGLASIPEPSALVLLAVFIAAISPSLRRRR